MNGSIGGASVTSQPQPVALIHNTEEWMADALCTQMPGDLFFPERGGDMRRVDEAKAVCARCDVRETCLAWALENDEQFGILGGLSPQQRKALAKRRKRTNSPTQCAYCAGNLSIEQVRRKSTYCSRSCSTRARKLIPEDAS